MSNVADETFVTGLMRLRHQEVRAIVTALGLGRRATQNQKAAWVTAIAAAWLDPVQQPSLLARLSPAAQGALWRLLQEGELPRLLFWGEYGTLRLPGEDTTASITVQGRMHAPQPGAPPWRQPQTVSEELFYAGLLLPDVQHTIDTTPTCHLPAALLRTLAPLLAERLGLMSKPRLPLMSLTPQPPPLLHDLAQWLIYLHQQHEPVLQQGQWLPPRRFQAFNARLLQPEQRTPLPTHKYAPWPALLSFLTAAAELVQAGRVTAAGWQWLAANPAQQLRILWAAWWRADQPLRLAYNQPAAQLPAPWPHLSLPNLTEIFTPAWLTNRLLARERAWHGYFIAHLPDLQTLDEAHIDLLAVLRHAFWAVTPAYTPIEQKQPTAATGSSMDATPSSHYDQAPSVHDAYQLTALGRWLLELPGAHSPLVRWQRRPMAAATLSTTPAQAQLAPFAWVDTAVEPAAVIATGVHTYILNATSVGQAAAAQYDLPTLLVALTTAGLTLFPDDLARLHTWYAAGRRLQLTLLPLVRTADTALMAHLQQNRRLHSWLGEVLNPTTAVWQGEIGAFLTALRHQGFYPDATALRQAVPTAAAADTEGDLVATPVPDAGVLWLAARTYQLLGRFLPLPFALPTAHIRTLEQALTPLQQAALTAHLAQLEARLLQLLDHLPLTAPPTPTDPAQWRPILDAAITAQQTLQMHYFSAGRNLTTQRLIDPYWLEEQHGVPYLRAYCHSAGSVLTFRLDRIQSLASIQK